MENQNKEKPHLWKPGQSGNPAGRPKSGQTMTDALRAVMDEKLGNSPADRKKIIAEKLFELAMDGDVGALKYVYDRLDGTPSQTVNQTVKTEIVNVGTPDFIESPEGGNDN